MIGERESNGNGDSNSSAGGVIRLSFCCSLFIGGTEWWGIIQL